MTKFSSDSGAHSLPTPVARVFLWLALLSSLAASTAPAADRQILYNHVPAAVANAAPLHRSPPWTLLNLTIGLPLRDRPGLTNLLQQLYDPASPNFRHYLTPEQFTERFGPTQGDYDAVANFAKSNGLFVTSRHSDRTLINVRGTTMSIERAFHVKMNEYQHPTEKRTFYAPDTDPSLDLTTPVISVAGLNNYSLPHPCMRPMRSDEAKPDAAGSGPGSTFLGFDFRSAYLPGVTLTGTGQTVGIIEFDSGFYQSDITAYESLAGLPNVPVSPVLLDGYNGGPGNGNDEVSLDVEMVISMAPGLAGVLVYEGSSTDDIMSRIAADDVAKQIAASWTYSVDAATEQYFLQFAAQGQSFFNASGDGDAYTGATAPPTDDPNITIVGGTSLTTVTAGGAWQSETTWNSGGGLGSAGGISTRFAIPPWQLGISMIQNQGSTTMRNIPDVSLTADDIYIIYGGGSSTAVVGTSCSVQLWAGLAALMNELAVTNGEATVGFINPAVYAIGKGQNALSYTNLFHDTTTGNNERSASPDRFVAVPGYDLCTGWGTPNGGNIITAIGLPEPLQIMPLTVPVFSGPVGGPFTPTTQTFVLTNNGAGSLNWNVANTSTWFTVSPVGGTVVPGAPPGTVTVNLTFLTKSLPGGDYAATMKFTDLGDSFAQSRQVKLAVVTPPIITLQPTNLSLLEGATATFTVGTAPNALISYQWLDNGFPLKEQGGYSGTATATLTISNISGANNGSYSVILTNAAGSVTSSNAVLKFVQSPPIVVQQPTAQTALPGATASFTVGAVGNTPYRYQWQLNGTNLVDNATYTGATAKSLLLTNILPSAAGFYSVVVGNFLGSTNSLGAALTVTPVTVPGLTMFPLVSFAGANGGANPYSPLIEGTDGSFYGTATEQGANDEGTVFKVAKNGSFTTLLSFKSASGSIPYAGLFQGTDGLFYGAAATGGSYDDGSLFKISNVGTLTSLATFNGNNGSLPVASMLLGTDGNFYGTALEGGAYGFGTVFRMSKTGVLTTVVSFGGLNGEDPSSALIQANDGNFYGTTEVGGEFLAGSVFKMSPSGDFTNLYSFTGGNDGAVPVPGLVQATDGNFYGTTYEAGASGFGTVFEMTPGGTLTTRYSFTAGNDGANPWGGLLQASDGNLYGTSQFAGAFGFGTIFQLAPTGSFSTVGQFDGYLGAYPSAALVQGSDGNLYGTSLEGGLYTDGVIYRLNVDGPLKITGQPANQAAYTGGSAAFTVATFGGGPVAYQWRRGGVNLTNGSGFSGANSATLTISNVTAINAAVYTVVVSNSFNSVTSDEAVLEVILSPPAITTQPLSQTCVEGMTVTLAVSVQADQPFTYQWQENGSNLVDSGAITGSGTSSLTLSNVTAANSGTYSVIVSNAIDSVSSKPAVLTVLPITSPAASSATLHLFGGGSDGAFPYGGIIEGSDGNLYGTAEGGGQQFLGTIFRATPSGNMTTIYSFLNTPGGAAPVAALIQAANGNFYGTATGGGVNSAGVIFRMTINPTVVKNLYSFQDADDGATPADALIQGSDGNLYGTAFNGGSYGFGSVYKMTSTGTVTSLYSFTAGDDGSNPYAGLIQGKDGNFYGTALEDGSGGFGTVFKMTRAGNLTTLASFDGTNGAFPQAGVVQGADGNLYGATFSGSTNGFGTVFSVTTNGVLTTLCTFAGTNGANPAAALVLGTDGNFYGTTSTGGAGGQGTAFRITPGGVLTTLLWFDGLNGADPESPMIQATDGSFYGTTAQGGNGFNPSAGGGNGAIFHLSVPLFISNSIAAASAVASVPYASSISSAAIDPAGDVLNFSKVTGPAWLIVSPNGALSGTPANSDIGSNQFTIGLSDSNGLSTSATVTIPVVPDPPPYFLLKAFSEPWANVDEDYSATIATNATDAEIGVGDILTFGMISGPAWLSVAPDGTLSGSPSDANAGANTFVVSVANLGGASNTATMSVYVNSSPSFAVRNFTLPAATEGIAYFGSITPNATDPDLALGDRLTFYKVSGPAWLNVAANGALSGLPTPANQGVNKFLVLVVDSGGLADTGNMSISVNGPSATTIIAQIALQGTNLTLSWSGGIAPYQVEMTTDLSSGAWQIVAGPLNTNSLVVAATNVSSYYKIESQ